MDNLTPIPGFENRYEVTEDGRVFSHMLKDYLKAVIDDRGTPIVSLVSTTGKTFNYKVHRLVAMTFKPNYDRATKRVRHIDGDKTNNNISNLEWY